MVSQNNICWLFMGMNPLCFMWFYHRFHFMFSARGSFTEWSLGLGWTSPIPNCRCWYHRVSYFIADTMSASDCGQFNSSCHEKPVHRSYSLLVQSENPRIHLNNNGYLLVTGKLLRWDLLPQFELAGLWVSHCSVEFVPIGVHRWKRRITRSQHFGSGHTFLKLRDYFSVLICTLRTSHKKI